jgi:hypothetical protein
MYIPIPILHSDRASNETISNALKKKRINTKYVSKRELFIMQLLKTSWNIKIRTVLYYEIQRHQSFKIEIKVYQILLMKDKTEFNGMSPIQQIGSLLKINYKFVKLWAV